ncbi:MAG: outer membrane lipid asymmetry maintenance protein MlaD [Kiloniellales bacterium]|jgi:phospholipid/cholesterol/gamma-HCH transport system substrate-binding protein
MKRNIIETALGAVVLLVAIGFLFFAFRATGLTSADSGYEVIGEFDDASGLVPGAEVRMSGVKIGTVLSQSLDPETFFAKVVMSIDDSIRLPTDTSARIVADGLLGGNYVSLEAGADEETIASGGRLLYTQGAINVVDLLGRFIFSAADSATDAEAQ